MDRKGKASFKKGFNGLRLNGNTFWLEKRYWRDFTEYEEKINSIIGRHRMIAICSYSLDKCGASEVIDVVSNHQSSLIRRHKKWELIEISEYRQAKEALDNSLKQTRQRKNELEALLQGSRAVLEKTNFEDAARSIFDSCKKLIGATSGYVALLSKDGSRNKVLFLDTGGHTCTVDPSLPMPIRGLRAEAYHRAKTVLNNDFLKSECVKYIPPGHVRLDNVTFAPLILQGKTVGVLGLANKPGGFNKDDIKMASAFGELAVISLTNSRTRELLETSEKKYHSIFETAANLITSVDKEGYIVDCNSRIKQILGYTPDEIIGQPMAKIIHPDYLAKTQDSLKEILNKGFSYNEEYKMVRKDGTSIDVNINSSALINERGGYDRTIYIINDITERKHAEKMLQKQRHDLSERVKELNCLYAISKLLEKPGISLEEILQGTVNLISPAWQYPEITCSRIILEDQVYKSGNFKETIWKLTSEIIAQGNRVGRVEVYYLEEKSEIDEEPFLKEERSLIEAIAERLGRIIERIWAEDALHRAHDELELKVEERTAELTRSNEQLRREIEERKRMEEALQESEMQLQYLSSQLLTFQEKERKRIVQELHDSVGQVLSALKYSVESILNQMSKRTLRESAQSLEAFIPKIQSTVEEVEKIGMGLRPSILDDLGIIATFSWFCREFETVYSGIRIEKDITIQENEVPEPLKLVVYRILQESLNNTAKHSKANLVHISFKKTDRTIELAIKDNGIGFDLKSTHPSERYKDGLGLISMMKRTELSGGSFSIKSDKESGTTIRALWTC